MLTLLGCLFAAIALMLVVGAVLVALPLAVLAFVACVVIGVLLCVAGALTFALSPLLWCVALAWLIWRIARGPRRRATIAA